MTESTTLSTAVMLVETSVPDDGMGSPCWWLAVPLGKVSTTGVRFCFPLHLGVALLISSLPQCFVSSSKQKWCGKASESRLEAGCSWGMTWSVQLAVTSLPGLSCSACPSWALSPAFKLCSVLSLLVWVAVLGEGDKAGQVTLLWS